MQSIIMSVVHVCTVTYFHIAQIFIKIGHCIFLLFRYCAVGPEILPDTSLHCLFQVDSYPLR